LRHPVVSKNKQAAEITQVLRETGIEATDEAKKASVVEGQSRPPPACWRWSRRRVHPEQRVGT
jgi:hypothetical protein